MPYKVPFVDPKEHYRRLKPEIDAAITDCLDRVLGLGVKQNSIEDGYCLQLSS